MYDDLVKRLRSEAVYLPEKFSKNAELLDVLMKAAEAIEELIRENESLAKSVNEAAELLHKRRTSPTQSNTPNTLKALTNADRIRAMTDMELAKELSRIHGTCEWCPMHDDCDGENCDGQLLDWMKQEAE